MGEDTPTIVETTAGKIEGIFRKGLYAFRGVPYATPPVGRLRWLPPEPVEPWSGVRPALRLASIAPQNPMGFALLDSPVPPCEGGTTSFLRPKVRKAQWLNRGVNVL